MEIDVETVIEQMGAELRRRSGNLKCPFCGKMSFKVYDDAKAHCHNNLCKWSGNAYRLYADYKKISYEESREELNKLYKSGKVFLRKLTYDEAKKKFIDDLRFLSECRMYFAFYGNRRASQTALQRMSGVTKGPFSKVLDGKLDGSSAEMWAKVILFLKTKINLKQFRQDISGDEYFERMIEEEQLGQAVKKLMHTRK